MSIFYSEEGSGGSSRSNLLPLFSVVESKLRQEFDGQWVHACPGNLFVTNALNGLASLGNLSNQRGVLIPSVVSWWRLNAIII